MAILTKGEIDEIEQVFESNDNRSLEVAEAMKKELGEDRYNMTSYGDMLIFVRERHAEIVAKLRAAV